MIRRCASVTKHEYFQRYHHLPTTVTKIQPSSSVLFEVAAPPQSVPTLLYTDCPVLDSLAGTVLRPFESMAWDLVVGEYGAEVEVG